MEKWIISTRKCVSAPQESICKVDSLLEKALFLINDAITVIKLSEKQSHILKKKKHT